MNLQFVGSQAVRVLLEPRHCDADESNFSISVGDAIYDDSDLSIFSIGFKIEMQHAEGFWCEVIYRADFKCSEEISEQFKKSHFPKVNAPAIAFPFFRAFLSNFLLQAGLEPVILPSINFTKTPKE